MISIFLNYASIILYYLDTTEFLFIKTLVQSSRNCVLRAVYSDCILLLKICHSDCILLLKISHSLCGKRVRVFVNKTLTTVSNP